MAALGGLSDQAAEKQLTQMIDFIKLEAREKAEEIRAQVGAQFVAQMLRFTARLDHVSDNFRRQTKTMKWSV